MEKKGKNKSFLFFSGAVPENHLRAFLQHYNGALTIVLCNSPKTLIIEFCLLVDLMPP